MDSKLKSPSRNSPQQQDGYEKIKEEFADIMNQSRDMRSGKKKSPKTKSKSPKKKLKNEDSSVGSPAISQKKKGKKLTKIPDKLNEDSDLEP